MHNLSNRRTWVQAAAVVAAASLLAACGKKEAPPAGFAALKNLKVGVRTGTTGDEAVTKLRGKASTDIR